MTFSLAPLMPPALLTSCSNILSVTVLLRPHSAKGPLLGTIAPIAISRPAMVWACAEPATTTCRTVAARRTDHFLPVEFIEHSPQNCAAQIIFHQFRTRLYLHRPCHRPQLAKSSPRIELMTNKY